ncbi:MAG: PorT family protein [Dysgonamonadaceae bacterium]|nr:PorT family protein [Dysgonamonadaceae bacterium]
MRFRLVMAGILLVFFSEVAAQDKPFEPEWAFGINGGATLSKISFDSQVRVPQTNLRQATGGVTVRYISENHFGLLGELNYSMRGWKEKTDTSYINRYARSIAYVELPVMTQLYFDLGKQVRLLFNAGTQISYFLNEKTLEREEYIDQQHGERPYYDLPVQRKFDYGIRGGAGLEFRTAAGSFILDGAYFFGLSDIFDNTRADYFQASHNQVVSIRLTYLVGRGRRL